MMAGLDPRWTLTKAKPALLRASDLASSNNGTMGSALVGHLPDGAGAQGATVFSILRQRLRLKNFTGADPSGATSSRTALVNAIAEATLRGGDEIDLGYGEFMVDAAVDMPQNVYLVGRGPRATRLKGSGNHRIIQRVGSSGGVINRGGVIGLTLVGSGKANTNSIGLYEAWTNRSISEDIITHACYIGFYASNVWQLKWNNLHPNGAGSDQNEIGFYQAETDPSNPNNAVIATGCTAQGVASYGWRIINGNGSKYTSCEGMDGVHGFYVGDPTAGTEACRWLHFVNCLADTQSGHNWRFERGSASAMEQIQLTNIWGGTSTGGSSLYIGNGQQMIITSPMLVAANQRAMYLSGCNRLSVTGGMLVGYDAAAAGNAGVALVNSTQVGISGSHIYSTSGTAKAVVETGTSNDNIVVGNYLQSGYTRLGANSRFMRNQGAGGERRGSTNIGAASTSVTVTHNCEGSPSIDDVRLTARDNMGSATKMWASNMTATTFDVNVNVAPGSAINIAWAIDQIGQ